ncbi:hypothetical protein GCM10014713_32870 [Streptomyces purpureus]|uniref:Uncharacterized protein n=1 Tax=Streptomyces purpureus TaxID=1951 RepID=A0A918H4D8_9ACTN|nr:hypothetical protein GCM10014713_32870 [Streptomyces purpureus]
MATAGSDFALTEARIGVAPAVISLTLLPKVDARAAARYYLTGERFDAAAPEPVPGIDPAEDVAALPFLHVSGSTGHAVKGDGRGGRPRSGQVPTGGI